MLRTIVLFALTACPALSVAQDRDPPTVIKESGYYIGSRKVVAVIVASNPFSDKFASSPTVRVTLRATDGSIIATQDKSSADIPPKRDIVFCVDVYFDERPARVEIQPLSATYEPALFRVDELKEFQVMNIKLREDSLGRLIITGELRNPYPVSTGAWVTFLFRDAKDKIVFGVSHYLSEVPSGSPSPFAVYVDVGEIPPSITRFEHIAFDHINHQPNWLKLLRAP